MKTTIRMIGFFLTLCMLLGCGGTACAESDSLPMEAAAQEKDDLAEQTAAQAFAVAMACWESGFTEDSVRRFEFVWETAGWYAAWLYRTAEADLVREDRLEEFVRSLGWDELPGTPGNWLGSKSPTAFRNEDGSLSYHFREFHLRIDELLGQTIEISEEPVDALTEKVSVIEHLAGSDRAVNSCVLTFEKNPDLESSFPYRLSEIGIPEQTPETDPALTFTWEELQEANRLDRILEIYPSVRISDGLYETGVVTWLFLHGNYPVLLTDAYGMVSGQAAGCFFECEERPVIRAFEDGAGSMDRLNGFLMEYLNSPALLKLDRIEEDLIWADAVFAGGYRQKLAVDRGTLVLREVMSLSENGEVLGVTLFDYMKPAPNCGFLDSWDQPLRTVTVIWENYHGGARQIRREQIHIPRDWEYFPNEALFGDYTAYTNEEYLGEYCYPGDGSDYLLFLTTVKG